MTYSYHSKSCKLFSNFVSVFTTDSGVVGTNQIRSASQSHPQKANHILKKLSTWVLYGTQILFFNPMIFWFERLSLVEITVNHFGDHRQEISGLQQSCIILLQTCFIQLPRRVKLFSIYVGNFLPTQKCLNQKGCILDV